MAPAFSRLKSVKYKLEKRLLLFMRTQNSINERKVGGTVLYGCTEPPRVVYVMVADQKRWSFNFLVGMGFSSM